MEKGADNMKANLANNYTPNEITLGSFNFNKIRNDGYIAVRQHDESLPQKTKPKWHCRKINLPTYFNVLENYLSLESKTHLCLTLNAGNIRYNSFDKNCVIFGRFCEVYKIHKIMREHGTEHFYNGNIINYFDL